ncbi:DUF2065 domain-containing protein [Andreprevotia chitinilytica]|uniref:DUF2065 domain-containing protein n=1 Tax=Andreprevotia chitinilytica TaxID=396808 RepID=UPI0005541F17|nr:DUF2065 domain-containing protein [Andreprevotia chitinilytica]
MNGSIGLALALVLVFEGILPFASPGAWKRTMGRLAEWEPRQIRIFGFLVMMAGLLIALALH